jgi:hypothetical protein
MTLYSYFTVRAEMKRRGRGTSSTKQKDNTSLVQDESNRKSYTLRKRKYGAEENDPGEHRKTFIIPHPTPKKKR